MKNKDDLSAKVNLLTLTPIEDYQSPDLPTYADDKPNLKKKMPHRWKSKVMVAAVAGLLGASMLTGCSMVESLRFDPFDYATHHGGFSGAPIYVAYLTEQDALEIIRTRLEDAGLNFNSLPPAYTIIYSDGRIEREVGLDLFDEEAGVAIALFNDHGGFERGRVSLFWSAEDATEFAHGATNEFNNRYDLLVRVFTNREIGQGICDFNRGQFNRRKEEMNEELHNELDEQIQDFIRELQVLGIID